MNKIKDFIKTPKGKSIFIISIFILIAIIVTLIVILPNKTKNKAPIKLFDNRQELEIKKAKKEGLELEKYDGGFYSIDLPKGWEIKTAGQYEGFSFLAYDPKNPEYAIFYYGKLEPFMKTLEAKRYMQNLAKIGGGTYYLFAEAPVLNPATAEELFMVWPDLQKYSGKYGKEINYMDLTDFKVIERLPYKSVLSSAAKNEGMIRGQFTNEKGTLNQGLFAASIIEPGKYAMFGTDMSYYIAYSIMGITAPDDKFLYLENDLAKSLSSFKMSDAYAQQGVAQNRAETQSILSSMKQMSQAYESYNNAWSQRQTTYDVISQKRSDATLGYARVKDKNTGEIYKAENGFYETYDANREDYKNQNLELVTDNNDYLESVDGYIYK